jgi:hypothetical protein
MINRHPQVRSEEVTARVVLYLERFVDYLTATYATIGSPRWCPGTCSAGGTTWRVAWASTVNHHLAPVSGFLAWVVAQGCGALPEGNPAAGVRTLVLPPPGPWALTPAQVRCGAEVT